MLAITPLIIEVLYKYINDESKPHVGAASYNAS